MGDRECSFRGEVTLFGQGQLSKEEAAMSYVEVKQEGGKQ